VGSESRISEQYEWADVVFRLERVCITPRGGLQLPLSSIKELNGYWGHVMVGSSTRMPCE
jgi:hypothetical protein